MIKLKDLYTYQNNKFPIPFIVISVFFTLLSCIFELEQITPAYSVAPCEIGEIANTSPIEISNREELSFDIDRPVIRALLDIQIISESGSTICHEPATKTYRALDNSDLTLKINPLILADSNSKTSQILDLSTGGSSIKKLIDYDEDDILDSLDNDDGRNNNPNTNVCATSSSNTFECSRGETTLRITPNDQNIILGASATNSNGIIVIAENVDEIEGETTETLVEACDGKSNYSLQPKNVIEIVCE